METKEWLKRTPAIELCAGDKFVRPDYLSVYREDKDGWSSLRPDAGTRFEVLQSSATSLAARRDDGAEITQAMPPNATVLKVVERGNG